MGQWGPGHLPGTGRRPWSRSRSLGPWCCWWGHGQWAVARGAWGRAVAAPVVLVGRDPAPVPVAGGPSRCPPGPPGRWAGHHAARGPGRPAPSPRGGQWCPRGRRVAAWPPDRQPDIVKTLTFCAWACAVPKWPLFVIVLWFGGSVAAQWPNDSPMAAALLQPAAWVLGVALGGPGTGMRMRGRGTWPARPDSQPGLGPWLAWLGLRLKQLAT